MTEFSEMLKSSQWSQDIEKSIGLSTQFSEMFKAHEPITKSLGGLTMMMEIAKNMKQQRMLVQPILSAIDAMTKSVSWYSKFAIPQTTLNTINFINTQHEQLFGGLRVMGETLKFQSFALAQISNLQFALNGISGQIATIAAQQSNWLLIEDFEVVNEQALEFSETLTEEITEEHQRQFQILVASILAFINKHKQKGIHTFRVLEVLLVFYSVYEACLPKAELASQEDIKQMNIKQDIVLQYIHFINEQLRQAKEYRITNKVCEVKLKPKSKTITLTRLPTNFEVMEIQIHHKWIYVSYFDPKDNLPQTGWIMKKYLDKPSLH